MPDSLDIDLVNTSKSGNLHAYVTGRAIQQGSRMCLLKSDGHGLYFPTDPEKPLTALTEDCSIWLGNPGSKTRVSIPQMEGGRIWLADGKLTFLVSPSGSGPAIVEPSVLNPSDPNAAVDFGFAEFTLDHTQLYANISYVDWVPRLPIGLSLQQANGQVQHTAGMAADSIDHLATALRAQASKDNKPWDKLIVGDKQPLRILNPSHGAAVGASFDGYYEPLVEDIWKAYKERTFTLDTQSEFKVLQGSIKNDKMDIGGEIFEKPTTADILGCNSGPFAPSPDYKRQTIVPKLAAAFYRSALGAVDVQPSDPSSYYKKEPVNHFARLVHQYSRDGKGYAFAYDDVVPQGAADISGKVNAGDPVLLTVEVGGQA